MAVDVSGDGASGESVSEMLGSIRAVSDSGGDNSGSDGDVSG